MTSLPSRNEHHGRDVFRKATAAAVSLSLAACSSLGASGPTARGIRSASAHETVANADIKIIRVDDSVARRVIASGQSISFADALGDAAPIGTVIGPGDVLEVSIWEAPPAALFGTTATFGATDSSSILASTAGMSQNTTMSEMMVDTAGRIRIPFAGSIQAAGLTPTQVERAIAGRLAGKAHDPQVIVRLARNASANVTVVGDVATNGRVPLSPRGERLLDIIAASGGAKQPIDKTTIQITRAGQVVTLPLQRVIRDPAQNIRLQPDDVVTAIFQPYSFTSLGATGNSAEVPFESTGITLAQALGRVGGLNDARADVRGVFIFRLEDPAALDPAVLATARQTPDGRVPVIYQVDMRDPATFFVAQSFPIRNKDVLYVSNAPLSDLQKFVNIVSGMAFSIIGLGQRLP